MADEPGASPMDAPDQPRIGVDEWVASVEGKREGYEGLTGRLQRMWDTLPVGGRLLVFAVPAAIFPLVTTEGNVFRYGLITLIYALLALGLNVVVGFAGLLDLGYIAFFGFGAYMYGILASGHSGHHWPAEFAIPVVILAGAALGLLLGLPSRRLLGDYLAIVTLFFGQAFVVFVNNANRINFPFVGHVDLTGGANGLDNIDPLDLFGWKVTSTREYYFFTLGAFVLVMMLLYFVNESRTGRAWRALREDPLAAEVMSMPVNRLKLLAFVFGAATAAFAGTIYGAVQTGAFPGDFDVGLLITIYAIVILGGAGSLAGIVVGAIVVNGVPELLRDPNQAEWVFYVAVAVVLFARLRPWPRLAGVVAGTIGLGFALHAIADAAWPRLTDGKSGGEGALAHAVESWVLLPSRPTQIANFAFVILIGALLALTLLKDVWRTVALVPTVYLAVFVWENLLIQQTAGATRFILLGALLVVLMNARPQGLFGTARVEIV
ncbi:MAG TPA: branched-chain amino acid ABC transporter permease [Gaiellaceae bacterium]|nr:branched-chain amino acid ABC transporter permease [Gaiellaceae bacterium]